MMEMYSCMLEYLQRRRGRSRMRITSQVTKRASSPQPLEGGLGLVDEPPVGLLALVRAVVVKVESLQVLHDLVGVDGLAPVVHDHLRMFPDGEKEFFSRVLESNTKKFISDNTHLASFR